MPARCLGVSSFAFGDALIDDHFRGDIGDFAFLPRLDLLPHRFEVRLLRSTPTEMQAINENDFECLAKTGVTTQRTMFPDSVSANIIDVAETDLLASPVPSYSTSGLPVIQQRPESGWVFLKVLPRT